MKKKFEIISLLLVAASMLLIVLGNFNVNVTKGGESPIQTIPSDLPDEPTEESPTQTSSSDLPDEPTEESPTQTSSSDLPEEPTEEVPPDLLVIPEVPMGAIAAILACFFALMVSQRKHAAKQQ